MANQKRIFPAVAIAVLVAAGITGYMLWPSLQTLGLPPAATPTPAPTETPSHPEALDPAESATPLPDSADPAADAPVDLSADEQGLSRATVLIETDRGQVRLKLFPNDAPKTVARFAQLIQSGFYNGLVFHRVVPGFVVQGGDPTGKGSGGSGQKIPAEFNDRNHAEGALAMARTSDPDSADSQFYITLAPRPELNRKYTVFGQVMEGMDVVRRIQVGDKMNRVSIR